MWTLPFLLPVLIGDYVVKWDIKFPVKRLETVYEVKFSEGQLHIDCAAGRNGITQIRISEIPHFIDGFITTFAIQGCALPDVSLQSIMDASGATSASSVSISDVPLVRSANLIGVRADAIHIRRSGLSPETFNQQSQWKSIKVFNSKINLLNTSINDSINLEILKLIKCNITHIPLGMFRSMPQLKHLHLRENLITQISNTNFEGLKSLTILDLSQNRLTSIPDNFLQFMPTLEELYISSNSITEITSNALQGANLTRLNLNDNKVSLSLAPRALASMRHLKRIILINSGIKVLPEDLMQGTTKLEYLHISHSLIEELPPNLFADQVNLRFLRLNYSRLRQLSSLVFTPLRQMHWLELDYNNIIELPKDLFASMNNISYLSIKNNGLYVISRDAFPDNCRVSHLNLNGNALTMLETTTLPNLHTLELQGNLFTSIPPIWRQSFPALKNINLKRNLFTQINASDLSAISHCNLLDLSDNMLTSVLVEQNSTVPEKIFLIGAPLRCDCNIRAYATLLREKRMKSDAVCAEPTSLSGIKLTSVTMTDFICPMISCPISCKCVFKSETKNMEVECVKPLTTEQFIQL